MKLALKTTLRLLIIITIIVTIIAFNADKTESAIAFGWMVPIMGLLDMRIG